MYRKYKKTRRRFSLIVAIGVFLFLFSISHSVKAQVMESKNYRLESNEIQLRVGKNMGINQAGFDIADNSSRDSSTNLVSISYTDAVFPKIAAFFLFASVVLMMVYPRLRNFPLSKK